MPTLIALVWLQVTVRQNTYFGCTDINGTDNIGLKNNEALNRHCDLDLEHSHSVFPRDTPAYNDVQRNKVWSQKDQQF